MRQNYFVFSHHQSTTNDGRAFCTKFKISTYVELCYFVLYLELGLYKKECGLTCCCHVDVTIVKQP